MPLKLIAPKEGRSPHFRVRGTYLGQHVDRSTKLADRGKAAKLLKKWEAEIERGEFARPGDPTFADAVLIYIRNGGEKRFLEPVTRYFGDTPLQKIDQAAIDRAADALLPGSKPTTRNRKIYTPVSAVLNRAGIHMRLKRPIGAAGETRLTWLWPEDAYRLLDAAEAIYPQFGIFCTLSLYTGLRFSEVRRITIGDVRLNEAFLYCGRTKNGLPRPVSLPPVAVAALANYERLAQAPIGERLFSISKNTLYAWLAKAAKAASVTIPYGTAFHLFRHTYGAWMRRYAGLDTSGLVATGTWRSRQSAAIYEHAVPTEEARKSALLPVGEKRAKRSI